MAGDIEGVIGDLVFYRRKGKPCVRRRPVRTKKFTGPEKKNQGRFAQASKFASAVLDDATHCVRYEQGAKQSGRSAQNLAVSDFLHAPAIVEIDVTGYTGRGGDRLRMRVEEGVVGAAEVKVVITDRAKSTLESGSAAVDPDGLWWTYLAQKDVPADQAIWITVTAVDQPGNKTTKVLRHSTGA